MMGLDKCNRGCSVAFVLHHIHSQVRIFSFQPKLASGIGTGRKFTVEEITIVIHYHYHEHMYMVIFMFESKLCDKKSQSASVQTRGSSLLRVYVVTYWRGVLTIIMRIQLPIGDNFCWSLGLGN